MKTCSFLYLFIERKKKEERGERKKYKNKKRRGNR
jgi:hypothetical protein